MLDKYAMKYYMVRAIMSLLTQGLHTAMNSRDNGLIVKALKDCRSQLPAIRHHAESFNMEVSVGLCDQMLNYIAEEPPTATSPIQAIQAITMFESLHKSLEKELGKEQFYWVKQDKVKYYNLIQFTEADVNLIGDRFDMEEAGICLSLECSTACVFHLSRVIESALKAVANKFAFPYSPSWDNILKRMRDKRDALRDEANTKPHPKNASELRRLSDFLADVEAKSHSIKDSWRNSTIHNPAKRYNTVQAESLLRDTQAFMATVSNGFAQNGSSS